MAGKYDSKIAIPVDGQRIGADQYGKPVRDAILDLDSRTSVVENSLVRVFHGEFSANGTATPNNTNSQIDTAIGNITFTAVLGIRYRLVVAGRSFSCTVAGDRFAITARYEVGNGTGGAGNLAPTSSSTMWGNHNHTKIATPVTGSNGAESWYFDGSAKPGSGLFTIGLFYNRVNGTGLATPVGACEVYVEGVGPI